MKKQVSFPRKLVEIAQTKIMIAIVKAMAGCDLETAKLIAKEVLPPSYEKYVFGSK